MKGLTIRSAHVKYESPSTCNHKSLIQLKFLCWSNSKVKGQKVKVMVSNEKSHQKEKHVKYETSTTYQSKVMTKVKVFEK
jgi:hypothetical protein